MKTFIALSAMLAISASGFAAPGVVRSSVPAVAVVNSVAKDQPVYILKSQGKHYLLDVKGKDGISIINQEWISEMHVFNKDHYTESEFKDVKNAKNGIIIVSLNDEKYPDAFGKLKTHIKTELPAKHE